MVLLVGGNFREKMHFVKCSKCKLEETQSRKTRLLLSGTGRLHGADPRPSKSRGDWREAYARN